MIDRLSDRWRRAPKTLEDPMTSHCVICGELSWLSALEMFTPALDVAQLRCRRGTGCRRHETGATSRVEIIEEPNGKIQIQEIEVPEVQADPSRPGLLARLRNRGGKP